MAALRIKPGLNQHTPIIMISAMISELPEKLKDYDLTYFVDKPIDFARLARYVKMAMQYQKKKKSVIEIAAE